MNTRNFFFGGKWARVLHLGRPLLLFAYVIRQRSPVGGGMHSAGFNSHTQIIVDVMQLFVRFAEKRHARWKRQKSNTDENRSSGLHKKTLRWYSESAYVIGECAFVQFMLDGAQCLAQIVVSVEDGFVSVSGGQHTSSTCTQCHSFDSTTLLVTMTLHSWWGQHCSTGENVRTTLLYWWEWHYMISDDDTALLVRMAQHI